MKCVYTHTSKCIYIYIYTSICFIWCRNTRNRCIRCIPLHCITLQYTATDNITMYSVMHCVILHYIALQYITLHYFTLHYIHLQEGYSDTTKDWVLAVQRREPLNLDENNWDEPTCCTDCGPKSLRESKAASDRLWIRGSKYVILD